MYMMSLTAGIKKKIKKGISNGANKFLSARVRDELGINQPSMDTLQTLSQSPGLDSDLNTFYKPVNSTFLSASEYKSMQKWAIALIAVLSIALIWLFLSLILPKKDFSNARADSQIIVDGNIINETEEGPKEIKQEDIAGPKKPSEELQIENITLSKTSARNLAQNSPLLKSNEVTLIEYTIRSGDTLEVIARKFYGNSAYSNIQKIKTANKIRNARLIQIGQKIIIPM